MKLLKENAYKSYSLYKMQESDFLYVKNFLDAQRNRLEKIEFFYPYKDEELKAVLSDGIFWGLFDKDRIIATFAIDTDEEYAKQIADIINSCRKKDIVDKAYESSGLMVDEDYRGQGIANFMMRMAVDEAQSRGINICGVVHTLNAASMTTFFSKGFTLQGVWNMCKGYDFVYLLKCCDGRYNNQRLNNKNLLQKSGKRDIIDLVEFSNADDCEAHRELLGKGYYGILWKNNRICFVRE